jgi:SAM-dependent methyltransferase
MIKIEELTHDMILQDGIWRSIQCEKISYPSDANDFYFEIEDQSFWFRTRNLIIREIIEKYSIKGTIFDVGGGNGFISYDLQENGFDTVLVEPSLNGCLNARKRGLQHIINSSFDITLFPPESIPNIGFFDVLEHIDNQDNILDTARTVLVKDGRLFLTVPAFNWLWSNEDESVGHFRRYNLDGLKKLISSHGFEILFVTFFFSFLVLPILFVRTIPSKFGVLKNDNFSKKKQHISPRRINSFLNLLIDLEIQRIKNQKPIYIGSSLLLSAYKK